MILKIEWVDPGERIFRILLSHSKRKPFEIWFREEKVVRLEDYSVFDCSNFCCFGDKCALEDNNNITYKILENNTLSDFCIFMDDNSEKVKEFFKENSIDSHCVFIVPKGIWQI